MKKKRRTIKASKRVGTVSREAVAEAMKRVAARKPKKASAERAPHLRRSA